jgi:hypothetical protein
LFGLAVTFLWPLAIAEGGLLGLDTRILGSVMQLEFVVVISGGFLIMPLMFAVPWRLWVLKAIQGVIFLVFAVHFGRMAHGVLGWGGVLGYAGLTYATFSGVLIGKVDPDENALLIAETFLRWISIFALFPLTLLVVGAPTNADGWGRNAEILPAGVVYFTLLGAIELSGVFGLLRRVNWRDLKS